MADYHSLIARAVDGLADRSQPMRQAVYDRARDALIGQLRSYDPPLEEAQIEQERLKLEAAIERVEAQHAPPPPGPPIEPPAPPEPPPAPDQPPSPEPSPLEEPPWPHEPEPVALAPEPAPVEEPPPPPDAVPEPAEEPVAELLSAEPDPRPAEEGAAEREPRPPSVINLPRTHRQAPPGPVVLAAPTSSGAVPQPQIEIEVPSDAAYADGEPAGPSFPAEQTARPRVETRPAKPVTGGRARVLVLGTILLLVIGAIAVAAWHLRDAPVVEEPAGPAAQTEEPPVPGKLDDRIGSGPAAPAPSAASGATPVRSENAVQQAVLYEEDPANPQMPKTTVGRAVWRLEPVSRGQGQPLDTAIRADVEVKDAGFALALLFRRNLDPSLPASHTVELTFTTSPGDPGRVVRDVGLLQFKPDVSARGTPIAGLPVPVRENLFLIGFSNLPADIERNLELMRRDWVDLPIRFASGQRAIVSFQKGTAGTQVVADALRQWQ